MIIENFEAKAHGERGCVPIVRVKIDAISDIVELMRLDRLRGEIISFEEGKKIPKIKKAIFNNPATIVLWQDGTKTIVKCQNGEPFDKEKGLALCYMKKMLGNKGNFNNILKKYTEVEK